MPRHKKPAETASKSASKSSKKSKAPPRRSTGQVDNMEESRRRTPNVPEPSPVNPGSASDERVMNETVPPRNPDPNQTPPSGAPALGWPVPAPGEVTKDVKEG